MHLSPLSHMTLSSRNPPPSHWRLRDLPCMLAWPSRMKRDIYPATGGREWRRQAARSRARAGMFGCLDSRGGEGPESPTRLLGRLKFTRCLHPSGCWHLHSSHTLIRGEGFQKGGVRDSKRQGNQRRRKTREITRAPQDSLHAPILCRSRMAR